MHPGYPRPKDSRGNKRKSREDLSNLSAQVVHRWRQRGWLFLWFCRSIGPDVTGGSGVIPSERPQRKLTNTRAQTRVSSQVQMVSQGRAEGPKRTPWCAWTARSWLGAEDFSFRGAQSFVLRSPARRPGRCYRLKPSTWPPRKLLRGNATC